MSEKLFTEADLRQAFDAGKAFAFPDEGSLPPEDFKAFLATLTPQPATPCPDCKAIHELILHSPGTDWQKTVHEIEAIVEKKFVPQPAEPQTHASDKLRDLVGAVKSDEPPLPPEEIEARASHDHERGIYHKFNVTRTDGSSRVGGKHEGCEYFVLDMTHDQFAEPAIQAYAKACGDKFPQLAKDLSAKFPHQPQPPSDKPVATIAAVHASDLQSGRTMGSGSEAGLDAGLAGVVPAAPARIDQPPSEPAMRIAESASGEHAMRLEIQKLICLAYEDGARKMREFTDNHVYFWHNDQAKRNRAYAVEASHKLFTIIQKHLHATTQGDPVAWMSPGGDVSRSLKLFEEMGFKNCQPLYLAPPASVDVAKLKEWQAEALRKLAANDDAIYRLTAERDVARKASNIFEFGSKENSDVFNVLYGAGLVPNEKPGPSLAKIVNDLLAERDSAREELKRMKNELRRILNSYTFMASAAVEIQKLIYSTTLTAAKEPPESRMTKGGKRGA